MFNRNKHDYWARRYYIVFMMQLINVRVYYWLKIKETSGAVIETGKLDVQDIKTMLNK